MQNVTLAAELRNATGKGAARNMRRSGRVPAVVYGHGDSSAISLEAKGLVQLLNSEGGEHALVTLSFGGGKEKTAIIKDYQVHPMRGTLVHADFQEVSMDEKVKVNIEVVITGAAKGVKAGGILQHGIREVAIECVPSLIPEHIDIDVTELEIGDAIHVRDLKLADGVKVHTDEDAVLASVTPPISAAKLEEMLAAAPAAAAEPEVVGKGKAEEENKTK